MSARLQNQKGFTLLELLVVAAIIAIIAAIAIPSLLNARRAAWQSRAKGTLRSIGSSELAYQGTCNDKYYGSFTALQEDNYIADGYTLGNMIENYSMTWEVTNPYGGAGGTTKTGIANNSFTVIALPRDTRRGFLCTFLVTDDQVVRVFNEDNGNVWENVYHWDPIL